MPISNAYGICKRVQSICLGHKLVTNVWSAEEEETALHAQLVEGVALLDLLQRELGVKDLANLEQIADGARLLGCGRVTGAEVVADVVGGQAQTRVLAEHEVDAADGVDGRGCPDVEAAGLQRM